MKYNSFRSKIKAILLTIIVTAAACSMLFMLFRGEKTERPWKIAPKQAHRMQIEGINFNRMNQGRKEISIVADRFIIKKGKIGFFSTGLMSTARIENARIDIYAMPQTADGDTRKQQPSGETSGNRRPVKAASSQNPAVNAVPGNWSFGDLFGEETFASLLPSKNISAIEAVPVTVRLHDDRGVITQIVAASASVRLKDREILFNGRVRVSSGGAELSTERLVFAPLTAHLSTDKPYLLRRGDRTTRGNGLTTDIFLLKYPD